MINFVSYVFTAIADFKISALHFTIAHSHGCLGCPKNTYFAICECQITFMEKWQMFLHLFQNYMLFLILNIVALAPG